MSEFTYMGWGWVQWAWAAAAYSRACGVLPLVGADATRASVVQDWWITHREGDPDEPVVVLVDLFDNPVKQALPWGSKNWALRVTQQAAKQFRQPTILGRSYEEGR